jgi:hypothetical protein
VKLLKNANDTCAVLSEAHGGEAMKKASVFEWHKQFKEGHENMEDDERSGHLRYHKTDENIGKAWNLVHSDRCLSINQAYFAEIPKWLYEVVCRKRSSLKQFLPQNLIMEMEHPLHSPDFAPYDFFFFPKIKSSLKEDIQRKI